jgi:hypothetical protein
MTLCGHGRQLLGQSPRIAVLAAVDAASLPRRGCSRTPEACCHGSSSILEDILRPDVKKIQRGQALQGYSQKNMPRQGTKSQAARKLRGWCALALTAGSVAPPPRGCEGHLQSGDDRMGVANAYRTWRAAGKQRGFTFRNWHHGHRGPGTDCGGAVRLAK